MVQYTDKHVFLIENDGSDGVQPALYTLICEHAMYRAWESYSQRGMRDRPRTCFDIAFGAVETRSSVGPSRLASEPSFATH